MPSAVSATPEPDGSGLNLAVTSRRTDRWPRGGDQLAALCAGTAGATRERLLGWVALATLRAVRSPWAGALSMFWSCMLGGLRLCGEGATRLLPVSSSEQTTCARKCLA